MKTILIISIILIYFIYKKNKSTNKINISKSIDFNVNTYSSQMSTDERNEMNMLEKKYPKWYSENNTVGLCYKSENHLKPYENEIIVHYKTDKFAELFGRGAHCSYFPGYGKIYNKTFDVWYQDVGSKEIKNIKEYKEIGVINHQPFFIEELTGGIYIHNELERKKGYLKLYNGRDQKNKKNWYAGLKKTEYTGIITKPEKV